MNKKAEAVISEANFDWEKRIKKLSSEKYSEKDKEKLKRMVVEYLKRAKKTQTTTSKE